MIRIFFVNNAETDNDIYQDPSLTNQGSIQANIISDKLTDDTFIFYRLMNCSQTIIKPDIIYSSPMKSSIETCLPLAYKLQVPINIMSDLHEVGGCSHTGLTSDQIVKKLKNNQVFFPYLDVSSYGWWSNNRKETNESVNDRVNMMYLFLKNNINRKNNILVFSHNNFIKRMIKKITNIDLNIDLIPGSITCVEFYKDDKILNKIQGINVI